MVSAAYITKQRNNSSAIPPLVYRGCALHRRMGRVVSVADGGGDSAPLGRGTTAGGGGGSTKSTRIFQSINKKKDKK